MTKKLSNEEVNKRFAQYNIVLLDEYKGQYVKCKMKCHCGKEFYQVPKIILDIRGSHSCGCNDSTKLKDITGQKFNKLLILKIIHIGKKYKCLCLCDCGKIKICYKYSIMCGDTKSCGCIQKEIVKKIGYNNKNPLIKDEDRIKRHSLLECNIWSKQILSRDNYTCDICGKIGGKLNAHHLDGFNWCKEKRFDLNNGITLCIVCHKNFHKIYGNGNNTKDQYKEYKEKLCKNIQL